MGQNSYFMLYGQADAKGTTVKKLSRKKYEP
jgi:hypothetical protein